jgi:hypothetical protein
MTFTAEVIERGKQGNGAMAVVIVGDCPHMTLPQWPAGLAALQRLALTFFIAAEHHGVVGRIEINPNHVPELGFELLVARQSPQVLHPIILVANRHGRARVASCSFTVEPSSNWRRNSGPSSWIALISPPGGKMSATPAVFTCIVD